MSIWGKIIGGATGFAIGGPIGALLGLAAGHFLDRMGQASEPAKPGEYDLAAKRIAFTVALIVLGAKMAKADGAVTREEVHVFKSVFNIPPGEVGGVGKIFDEARRDPSGFEPYARQIANLFGRDPAMLEELVDGLFHIAMADGVMHRAELDYLRKVSRIFGLDAHRFERIRARHMDRGGADPYEILGVSHDASNEEVKAAHRRLIREHHPDRLVAQGMPQEFIEMGNAKMATINDAYDRIRKQRGLG